MKTSASHLPHPGSNGSGDEAGRQHYYRALTAKDSRFDGVFFTGVSTTGIYCRPICTVKTPRLSSCTFFKSAAAAEAAGYRPCLRCRPELAPYALQQNLAHAIWRQIAAGALNEDGLESFSARIGLSSRQVRRVLLQEFGVSPVELAQTQRLLFAKKLLQETRLGMAELAFAAGFGSVRRFNALFQSRYQLAPGEIRRAAGQRGDGILLRLAYRPPYDWDAVAAYLQGRAMPGLECVTGQGGQRSYIRSVRLDGYQGWLQVSHCPEKNQLQLQVAPELTPVLMPLLARVRQQFDLEANPSVIRQHLAADSLLAPVVQRYPGLRVPGAFDSFELAIRAVLGQQVSVAGATTVAGRLVQRFGTPCTTPFPGITHHFPEPATLAALAPEVLAGIGIPGARAASLQQVARFALERGFELAPGSTLEQVLAKLKAIRGVGEWTAQYIAMRALRFPDAFPAGDLGLQKAAAALHPGHPRCTEKQLLARAGDWSPWRSYAALWLWQSLSM
ncbi:DNA-3-methyladenine glycosylase 2 family protein [Undibacterium griseum]|uniref:DNA-3-methyladenine glycosylase II n=1 Tax=Undibacterium griseum TaxID=2762295 RepID=A0ABR6YIC1_9BURK|nr:DNA-3-methyladenine glycosylase 2 [Undibacterium griseum]MBC3883655.1 DNA-3-methyladenine glycosylase 2 family protein [Undibacterium griseum]